MIGILDAITLANTKLRSKRLLLITTIVISGLLFGLLYALVIITDGTSRSASNYAHKVQDGKYLVKSTPVLPSSIYGPSRVDVTEELIDQLTVMQADYTARQKDLAKQYGGTYDELSVEQVLMPDPYASESLPAEKQVTFNPISSVYQEYVQKLQKEYAATARNKMSDLKRSADEYGAVAYHQNEPASVYYANLFYLEDGKEDLASIGQTNGPATPEPTPYGFTISSARNSMYTFIDDSLIQRFILPENEKRKLNTSAVPVVITAKEAVEMFGVQYDIKDKPADPSKQIEWMKDLQQKINGATYVSCYRNQVEIAQILRISQTTIEMEKNKENKNYSKPALLYNPPAETCGAVTVKEDSRTAAEKKTSQQQEDISKHLGTFTAPEHHLFTFQIVGVMNVSPQESAMKSLSAFTAELLGARYGMMGAIIPKQAYEMLPSEVQRADILRERHDSVLDDSALRDAGIGEVVVEFASLDAARIFMSEQGCVVQDKCTRPFVLVPYGSNYLLMDDLNKTVSRIMQFALPIAVGVAGIIIWATMARVIIDSRHETAVFRAIGAKRVDIASIYLIYSFNVAIRVIIFALILGVVIAATVHWLYSASTTDYAKVAYGVFDQEQAFNFMGFGSPLLGILALCVLAVSMIAVLPPLIRNVRRNPIKDMRDE